MSASTAAIPTRQHRLGYRIREVREQTGASDSTIRRWIADGRLDAVHVGRSVFISPESVHALFDVDD